MQRPRTAGGSRWLSRDVAQGLLARIRDSGAVMGVVYVLVGAAIGLGYQQVIGCRSGGCLIAQSPTVATLSGALLGYVLSGRGRSGAELSVEE